MPPNHKPENSHGIAPAPGVRACACTRHGVLSRGQQLGELDLSKASESLGDRKGHQTPGEDVFFRKATKEANPEDRCPSCIKVLSVPP